MSKYDEQNVDACKEGPAMCNQLRTFRRLAVLGAALILAAPLAAQQPAGTAGSPTDAPTKKDPLRFSAFNVSMPTGVAGVTEIVIERWTTTAERTQLLALVETAKYGEGGQRKLLNALQDIDTALASRRRSPGRRWNCTRVLLPAST